MAETLKVASEEMLKEVEKQLNDRSYKGTNEESGVASESSGWTESENEPSNRSEQVVDTSGYDSSVKTAWEDFEGEIVNLSTFKLECLQSSNITRKVGECEISSIEHENGTPHLRRGNLESLLHKF